MLVTVFIIHVNKVNCNKKGSNVRILYVEMLQLRGGELTVQKLYIYFCVVIFSGTAIIGGGGRYFRGLIAR